MKPPPLTPALLLGELEAYPDSTAHKIAERLGRVRSAKIVVALLDLERRGAVRCNRGVAPCTWRLTKPTVPEQPPLFYDEMMRGNHPLI